VDIGVGLLLLAALLAAIGLWRREHRARERLARQAIRQAQMADRAAEERQQLELRHDLLADSSRDLLLILNRELTLTYANDAAEQFFGPLTPELSLIRYTQSHALEAFVREAVAGNEREPEGLLTVGDRPFQARARVRGEVVGLALSDAAEVQRLTRARHDLVANLSHELRTPLASLELLAETLQARALHDPALAGDLVQKILSEVGTLNQMTQEMLDLAAIESGRQVARLTSVALRQIVDAPVERLREQAARRDVRFEVDLPDEWTVLADPARAARAVQNVLDNAVKYSPPRGVVRLTGQRDLGGAVVLRIQDDGPGIPPAELERIFERFYRGDRARSTPGTGLGLSITRHILEAHGGHAWAENRPPPQSGAVVFLRFLVP